MPGYNADHQRNIDNQSPPDDEDTHWENLLDSLSKSDAQTWLIDAVATAVYTDDLPYLASQIFKHIGWKREPGPRD